MIKAQARATVPPAEPVRPAGNARPPRPYDPVGAALRRATASLRSHVAHETILAQAPAEVVSAAAPVPPHRPQRHALTERLRAGSAAAPVAATDPRGLLRAWARAP